VRVKAILEKDKEMVIVESYIGKVKEK